MEHATTESRITTGTDVHPLLAKESRWGGRTHPLLPATPGARFACVDDVEGWPTLPMEMSIWQHDTTAAHRRIALDDLELECIRAERFDGHHTPVYYEGHEAVTYKKYYPARCLESFGIDLLPHQGWKKDGLDGYLTDMGLKRTTTWGYHIASWFCAVTDE